MRILGVQLGLARVQIGLLWLDPASPLDDLPGEIETKEDWDADVRREEVCCRVLSYILEPWAQFKEQKVKGGKGEDTYC